MGWERRIIWALWGALAVVIAFALAALAGTAEPPPLGDRLDLDGPTSSVDSAQTPTAPSIAPSPLTDPTGSTSPPGSAPGISVVAPTPSPVRVPIGATCDDDDCDDDDDDDEDDDDEDDDD